MYSWLYRKQRKLALYLVPERTPPLSSDLPYRVRCLGQGCALKPAPLLKSNAGYWVLETTEFLTQTAKSFQKMELEMGGIHTHVPKAPSGWGDGPRVGREEAKPRWRRGNCICTLVQFRQMLVGDPLEVTL